MLSNTRNTKKHMTVSPFQIVHLGTRGGGVQGIEQYQVRPASQFSANQKIEKLVGPSTTK